MKKDWIEVPLERVAEELTVGFVGSMAQHYTEEGVPFLRSQDILPYRIDLSQTKYISEEFNDSIKKSSLLSGDVVVVRTGKPGIAAVIPDGVGRLNCSDLVIIRPGKRLSSKYLCYYINTVARNHISAHLVGAVQQHFNVGSAKQIKLDLPPLPIQYQIAEILSAFDDKIELNRQMNRTLEQMARALFKSWFIDFDPVHAKQRGEQPAGMDAETAALFPDRFVEIHGKEMPAEWDLLKISEVSSYLNRGIAPKYQENSPITIINQKCIRDFQINLGKARYHDEGKKFLNEKLLLEWDVLINSTGVGTLGRLAQVAIKLNKTTVDTHVTIVRPNLSKISPGFFGMQMHHMQSQIEALGEGSTGQTELSRSSIGDLPFLVASQEVMRSFDQIYLPMRIAIEQNSIEAMRLTSIRDSLLPRLLSGELDVSEWGNASEAPESTPT